MKGKKEKRIEKREEGREGEWKRGENGKKVKEKHETNGNENIIDWNLLGIIVCVSITPHSIDEEKSITKKEGKGVVGRVCKGNEHTKLYSLKLKISQWKRS